MNRTISKPRTAGSRAVPQLGGKLVYKVTRPTALVIKTIHCDKDRPLGPVCPDPEHPLTAADRVTVADLVKGLQVRSPDNMLFEYVRPVSSSVVTDIGIALYEGNSLVALYSRERAERNPLLSVKKGEAIQFTLKEAVKQFGDKLLKLTIVVAVAFKDDAPDKPSETKVVRSGSR